MHITVENSGLYMIIRVEEDGRVSLRHFAPHPYDGRDTGSYYPLVELHCLGQNTDGHHGSRHTETYPAALLRYCSHRLVPAQDGRELTVCLAGGGMAVEAHYRFFDGVPAVRCRFDVKNCGGQPQVLDYITSFAYYGVSDGLCGSFEDSVLFDIPYNTWHGELQWHQKSAWELGLMDMDRPSLRRMTVTQTGSWSSGEYAPVGVIENRENRDCLCWQIEHNGSWSVESGNLPDNGLYLHLTGPNGDQHAFEKVLAPGECFSSVPVGVGVSAEGFDGAVGVLTRYRRCIRRKNRDNLLLPVIYNDYMNCLMGDPTEEKILPLVDAAAAAGCEYYVMDAGWFSQKEGGDDDWWSSIGIWEPADFRFPHGLSYVMDYIREKGMIPGIWVELEDIGPDCPLAKTLPDDWFFTRRGRRVTEHGRYQLDYRNPAVRQFARNIVKTLVETYHVGYLKVDYNINAGLGTDRDADSAGDGLLAHCRCVQQWYDELFSDYPDLIVENCASGGMRMDYAMLSRLSIQSTSDQQDYRRYSVIAAMAATAVTPEQGACWSYPTVSGDDEETVYNMVNAMLGRVHLSGFLNRLPEATLARVKEALAVYRQIRTDIRGGLPVFPLGMVTFHSPFSAFGLLCSHRLYLSVWRRDTDCDTVTLSLAALSGAPCTVRRLYPADLPVSFVCDADTLTVTLPQKHCARLLCVEF